MVKTESGRRLRVLRLRGGAWNNQNENARLSERDANHPNNQWNNNGFRVAVLRHFLTAHR